MKLKQNRRNFLQISTTSMAIIGTGLAIWPFIDSMNPSADVLATGVKEVNLDNIKKGSSITVKWRAKPIFIKHRTDEEIKEAQEVNIDQLKDPQKDQDRVVHPEWLVIIGICTHLGCIPSGQKNTDTKGDFNGDGKNDYVVGNTGENNKFHPTIEHPLEIYCHDFDDSGSLDIVLGKYQNNTCYPIRGKQCSTEQMPFVSKKFPTYNGFANANLESIYGKGMLNLAVHYSATNFSSVILLSGDNGYAVSKLDAYAQLSPINAGISLDVNGDGNLDFVGIGNNYAAEVETVRYDAGVGLVLIGNGKGDFISLKSFESGFFTNSDDKDMIIIDKTVIVSSNNSNLKLFKIKSL